MNVKWIDIQPKVGDAKPGEYRFRPKKSSSNWHDGFDLRDSLFSEFNIDSYDYQIPCKEEKVREWYIDYDNSDTSSSEWWIVTDGKRRFISYDEQDAIFLTEKLNSL